MKITSFETCVVDLSGHFDPQRDGPATLISNFVTLRLRTDAGVEGIGYGGFVSRVMVPALKAAMDGLAELAIGDDPMNVEAISAKLLEVGGLGAAAGLVTRAVAAVDVALWDIKGKAVQQPLHRLLGGYCQSVPTYASGFLWREQGPSQLAETGESLVRQGFRAMKFRMGGADSVAEDVARMQSLREAIGDQVDLMVDINQGWDVNQTIKAGREMDRCGLYWLEDPIHHQDYNGLARVAETLDTSIAAGEYHYGMLPFQHMFERRSVDIAMIDLLRAGGITGWMKIAHLAEAHNLPVVSHLAPEILVHCMAAIPNGLYLEHMPWSLPLFQQQPSLAGGETVLSDAHGLGLDFDTDVVS